MLTVADEYTRECHLIHVARRIRSGDVLDQLFVLIEQHGAPEFIRSDNGSEFIEQSLQTWLKQAQIRTLFIDPGSPWQNGYIESFHSRFRDECLDREQLWTLTEARVVLEDWRREYNSIRPHKSLNLETPEAFARAQAGQEHIPGGEGVIVMARLLPIDEGSAGVRDASEHDAGGEVLPGRDRAPQPGRAAVVLQSRSAFPGGRHPYRVAVATRGLLLPTG